METYDVSLLRQRLDKTHALDEKRRRRPDFVMPKHRWELITAEPRLQTAAHFAYSWLPEWRDKGNMLIGQQTRIYFDPTMTDWMGTGHRTGIAINAAYRHDIIGLLASTIVHESIHATGSKGDLAEEVRAHEWTARCWIRWGGLWPTMASRYRRQIDAYRNGTMEAFVLSKPAYQKFHAAEIARRQASGK